MTKYWILLGTAFFTITSCGDTKKVQDTEKSLLNDTVTEVVAEEKVHVDEVEIYAVLFKEGTLSEKPERWSKTNPYVKSGKFYEGSSALILDTKEDKRRYLKLRLNDGTEGWVSDWLVASDAQLAVVVTKAIRLYKKADIAAFSDEKIVFGQKVALSSEAVGGFYKIVYKGADKKPHTFWVKEKDVKNISTVDTDYVLAEFYTKIQKIENEEERLELIDEIRDNEEYIKSPFYVKILVLAGEEEDEIILDEHEVEIDNEGDIILDTAIVDDEF